MENANAVDRVSYRPHLTRWPSSYSVCSRSLIPIPTQWELSFLLESLIDLVEHLQVATEIICRGPELFVACVRHPSPNEG